METQTLIIVLVLGAVVIVNSDAFVPVIVGALMLNTPLPVFNIVNILVNGVDPKSVKSVAEGVRSPSAIEVALPCTSISGYTIVAITAVLEDEVQVPLTTST